MEQAETDMSGPPPEETEDKKISPTLARLISEVQQEREEGGSRPLESYNRMHNRHNRSMGPRYPQPRPEPPKPKPEKTDA